MATTLTVRLANSTSSAIHGTFTCAVGTVDSSSTGRTGTFTVEGKDTSITWILDLDSEKNDALAIITFTDCKPNQSIFADYTYSQKQTITYELNNQSITAIGVGKGAGGRIDVNEPLDPIYNITVQTS
jgi:hypothetical protein